MREEDESRDSRRSSNGRSHRCSLRLRLSSRKRELHVDGLTRCRCGVDVDSRKRATALNSYVCFGAGGGSECGVGRKEVQLTARKPAHDDHHDHHESEAPYNDADQHIPTSH